MASGHVNRIKRPNTWLHRPMLQNVKKALANTEPSTHGTQPTYRSGRLNTGDGAPFAIPGLCLVAGLGITDMGRKTHHFAF